MQFRPLVEILEGFKIIPGLTSLKITLAPVGENKKFDGTYRSALNRLCERDGLDFVINDNDWDRIDMALNQGSWKDMNRTITIGPLFKFNAKDFAYDYKELIEDISLVKSQTT